MANQRITTYDPRKAPLVLGEVEVFGYAPGTKVSVSRTEARKMPQVGVDGDVAIALNANKLGQLTISLQNTSGFNNVLLAYTVLEDANVEGAGFFRVYLRDPASGMGIETVGWIEEQPDFSLSQEVDQMDWVIGLADASFKRLDFEAAKEIIKSVTDLI